MSYAAQGSNIFLSCTLWARCSSRGEYCNRYAELDLLQYSWRIAILKEGRLMAVWQSTRARLVIIERGVIPYSRVYRRV
jgi:hypothetical protein